MSHQKNTGRGGKSARNKDGNPWGTFVGNSKRQIAHRGPNDAAVPARGEKEIKKMGGGEERKVTR